MQEALVAAAEGAGFDAKLLGSGGEARLLLAVGGMVCAQCSAAVEACLRGRPGVSRACASLISNQAEARPMGESAQARPSCARTGNAARAASSAAGAGLARAWPARSRPPRRCDACLAQHVRVRCV